MPKRKTNDVQTDITPSEMPPPFNLWFAPWITLERQIGEMEQHGIEYALCNAHQFRAIYDLSPLVVVGIHRLLTAILQDALDPQNEDELHDLWQSGEFPADAIRRFGERFADRFDLFSPDRPFMQSADLPMAPVKGDNVKSVASLFAEVPSGTEVIHYVHSVDMDQVYSPAAVAAGIISIPAFASSGGQGIKPSINGVPPIYVLPGGGTLFESLCASLLIPMFRPPMASRKRDNCWWKRDELVVQRSSEVTEVGYLYSLTFPARRIRLHPIKVDAHCTRTGEFTEWGVRTMIFEMGESRPKDAPFWQDPFVAYRLPADRKPSRRTKTASTANKKDQPVPIRPQLGKASWREFGSLFLTQEDTARRTERPLVIQQMAELNLAGNRRAFPFRCVGILTDGKAKNFEWLDFGFDVPPSLLNDPKGATLADKAIVFADNCGSIISSVFSRQFGGNSRKSERHRTTKERMLADYWSTLGLYFRSFILELGDQGHQADAYSTWISIVVNTAKAMFAQAAESIGDDAANLRKRVEGAQHCSFQLNKQRSKEIPNE